MENLWSHYAELGTIIGTIVICFVWIHGQINDVRGEIQQQSQRTDRLYEMFIDLLKEKK